MRIRHHADGGGDAPGVRHGEVQLPRADAARPGLQPAGQAHRRLRPPGDLDVLPGERARDAEAERLANRLLAGEARRVVLGRVGARVAVLLLRGREAAVAERRVALEGVPDALDLDDVEPDLHQPRSRRNRGTSAIESTTASGFDSAAASVLSRNFPVRTRIARRPAALAPPTSASTSSPTMTASEGAASSSARALSKYERLGLPTSVASTPAAYSSPATNAPESRSGPREVCHQRLRC